MAMAAEKWGGEERRGEEGVEEFFQISGRASVWVVVLLIEMGKTGKVGFVIVGLIFKNGGGY